MNKAPHCFVHVIRSHTTTTASYQTNGLSILILSYLSDGDRVIRGAWPGVEPQIAVRLHLSSGCIQHALIGGEKAMADLLKHKCCYADVHQFGEALRMVLIFQRLQPLLASAVLRLKGETEAGDELSLD